MTEEGDILHYAGRRHAIYLVRDESGRVQAQRFMQNLTASDRAKLEAVLQELADEGHVHNTERFRMIDKVAEVKAGGRGKGHRLWGMWGPQGLFVTHGATKPKERQLKKELARAQRIFSQRRGR